MPMICKLFEVYCDAPSHKNGRRTVVERYRKYIAWSTIPLGADPETWNAPGDPEAPKSAQWQDTDGQWLDRERERPDRLNGPGSERFRLACPECGLTVEYRTGRPYRPGRLTFSELRDRLIENEIYEISLAALRGRLEA